MPGLRADLLLVVALVVVGVIAGGYIVSRYDGIAPWDQRYEFAADFDMAPGIQLSSKQEVRIAGVPVGKIVAADPTAAGKARLTLSLEPGHQVYSNAQVVVRSKTPLNVMYIELNPGGPPGTPLPQHGVIPVTQTQRVVQPYELLDNLDERTRDALTSLVDEGDVALAAAPQQLPQGLNATDAALGSLKPVVDQLQQRRDALQRLVTAVARISQAAGGDNQQLATLASSLQQTLSVLSARNGDLGTTLSQLPGLTGDLQHAASSVSTLTGELNPTLDAVHDAAGKLPGALNRLGSTVDSAGGLLQAAGPVVHDARPVVADLRPLVGDAHAAMTDLVPTVHTLPGATARIVPWLDDLAAFVYQTSSAFSLADANGGLGRAQVVLKVTDPTGDGLVPSLTNGGHR
ncbi:MCE family protein [Amycolatopsis sp. K13G38]|uniref:MCE family protein n=1 Tax=Amycolatopsis acididurans TaxID=2724524 RepID=A0ABX1J7G2_9PSEU|nr:MCE family protein [Amycolatopsis acididurans]